MVKTIITSGIKELLSHRVLTVLSIITLLLAISCVVYIGIAVHPSEVPLVTHYTAYGVAHLYRDQWFYLLTFGVFAVVSALVHISLTAKMSILKGKDMALLVAWLGIGVQVFAIVMATALITIWSPV